MSMPTLRRWMGDGVHANAVALAVFIHVAVLISLLLPRFPVPEPEGVAIELVQSGDGASALQTPAEASSPSAVPTPAEPKPQPSEPEAEHIQRPVYAAQANRIIRDDSASVTTSGEDGLPPQLTGQRNASPTYPPEAERRRLEGEVRLLIRVDRAGIPAAVEVVASSGVPMLDNAAVETMQTWRFAPARAANYPFNIRFVLGQR